MSNCDEGNNEKKFERKSSDFKDFERFKIHEKTFKNQFKNIYNARLNVLGERLKEKVKQKWGNRKILKLTNLSEIEEIDENNLVIVIGTLYKHQELKPSILKELSDELQLVPQPARSNYSSTKDMVFLEDESLRIKLVGERIDPKELITGTVCAVMGSELNDGSFSVKDMCFPGMYPRVSTSRSLSNAHGKILFLSGLDLANTPDCMHFELLIEWITGMAGDLRAQEEEAEICFVVIAGNSVRGSVELFSHRGYTENRNHHKTAALEATVAAHRFDTLLRLIVENTRVLLMPGQFDPASHSIPQPALHPCILPQSSRFKSFHSGTNPWIGKIGDRIVAGSSGQPVDDIMKVAGLMNFSPLEWLEKTLTWCHMAPTAPDTLPAYPYFDSDPFVMRECPDIYFIGNMEEYSTKVVIGEEGQIVRLIGIPKFSKTRTAVLVDLNSLETQPITFGMN